MLYKQLTLYLGSKTDKFISRLQQHRQYCVLPANRACCCKKRKPGFVASVAK